MIEIAKIVSYGSKVLIFDEPTSSLTDTEVERLFEIIQYLKSHGTSIIYISHRLEELNTIADRITILRDGYRVFTGQRTEIQYQEMLNKMVGRNIEEIFPDVNTNIGEIALEVHGMSRQGEFADVSFSVRKGEILGLAGLVGAGRTEVVTALFGENRLDEGEILINGDHVEIRKASDAVRQNIAFVTEDRKLYGLNLKGTVKDNIILVILKILSKIGIVNEKENARRADTMIDSLKIKLNTRQDITAYLSGGNQQKVVIAKWLLSEPDIIILDEPTRGIDVGAKSEVYKIINNLAREGKAVIMISSELPEIVGLCNRVVVLHEGRVTGELSRKDLTQENIISLAYS
jgi:ABC-type sugar transport system ATPase subunit